MELNCVTSLIADAEEQAVSLPLARSDEMPLFGLPVSLKDSMNVKGMDSTIGVFCFVDFPAKSDCVIAQVLKHCGAVPFAKTNIPQLMQSFGSSNPVFGETGNPYNVNFTPGGSSSGEGALVGAGGSLLGFGTDIAGSIRNPSHMCGIAGLKPTMSRLSKVGIRSSLPGHRLVASTVGPMARDVDTLVLTMSAILCPLMFRLDPTVPPLPFNNEIFLSKKKLRIGYYTTNGYIKPVPAITRAVEEAKLALENAGHTLIKFEVPRIADAMRIVTAALYADGGKINLKNLKFSEVDKRIKANYFKWKCPSMLRNILCFFMGFRWPRLALDLHLQGGGDKSVSRLMSLQAEADQYKREFISLWSSVGEGLDALICPPFPMAAGPVGTIVEDMTKLMSYTALYNLLDFPAGVVPITKVKEEDIEKLKNYRGYYGDPWDQQVKKVSMLSLGMPVGVQCVTLPWQEEQCLRVMKEIESSLNY